MGYVVMGEGWYYVATTEAGWTLWSPRRADAWVAPNVDAARATMRTLVRTESRAVHAYRANATCADSATFTMRPAMVLA
jgi:hypothetical protein